MTAAVSGGRQDSAARFYAAETAKVLQGFLHAAALTGRTLEHVLAWAANPVAAEQPVDILQHHPHAARFWDGLLHGALHGAADTVGNTVTTVQQAMGLFFQPDIRARCTPTRTRPATDLGGLINLTSASGSLGQTGQIFGQTVQINFPAGVAVISVPGTYTAGGKLLEEGTLEELRGRAGSEGMTLEDIFIRLTSAA